MTLTHTAGVIIVITPDEFSALKEVITEGLRTYQHVLTDIETAIDDDYHSKESDHFSKILSDIHKVIRISKQIIQFGNIEKTPEEKSFIGQSESTISN